MGRRRASIVAFALLASLLVVTATPAIAVSTNQAVASIHNTSTDFNAGTLTNVTVEGSGSSAYVDYNGTSGSQSFSYTGSAQTWTVPTFVTSIHVTLAGASGGGNGGGAGGTVEGDLPVSGGQTVNIYVGAHPVGRGGGFNGGGSGGHTNSGLNGYGGGGATDVRIGGTALSNRKAVAGGGGGFGQSSADRTHNYAGGAGGANTGESGNGGYSAATGGTQSAGGSGGSWDGNGASGSLGQGGNGGTYGDANPVGAGGGGGGGYYGGGGGGASAASGATTDGYGAGGAGGSNYVGGFSSVTTNARGGNSGDGSATVSWSKPASGTYISDTHNVDNPTNAFTDIVLNNVQAEVTWQEYTGGSWSDIRSDSYTTTGNKSVDISSATSSKLRVNVTFIKTGSNPTARLNDEGVKSTNHAPSVDNSTASPNGSAISKKSITLSVQVNDSDFPTVQGDQVTATFYVNGSQVGTDSLTSNGTTSISYTPTIGGTRQWHVELADEYGGTATSSTFYFTPPSALYILNESNPTHLVDNATVDLEFYVGSGSSSTVYTRNTSTGVINMAGLPANEPFIVVAKEDGYVSRRIYVESLFDTQQIYLLPDSGTTYVTPTFVLQDYSGDYPPEDTVLQIQRVLNGSWQTVEGDYFGATGEFPAHLTYNERHRLTLINTQTGDTKYAGTFTPVTSSTQEINVFANRTISVEEVTAHVDFSPSITRLPASDNVTINATFLPGSSSFSSYSVSGQYEYPNGTTVALFSSSGSSSSGETLSNTVNLTGLAGGQVTVDASWMLTSGTSDADSQTYFVHEVYQTAADYSVLGVLGQVHAQLPSSTRHQWEAFVALFMTAAVVGLVGYQLPIGAEGVGILAVAIIAAFVVIQWLSPEVLFIASIAWVAVAAIRRGL